MLTSKLLISGILISTLSACGGGGSGVSTPQQSINPSYNFLAANYSGIIRRHSIDGTGKSITPVVQMPTNGIATYKGTGAVFVGSSLSDVLNNNFPPPALAGEANLTADFRNREVRGTIDRFRAASGQRTTGGNLRLSTAIEGNAMIGTLKGNVNLNGKNHNMNLPTIGRFIGRNADAVAIAASGKTSQNTETTVSIAAEQ